MSTLKTHNLQSPDAASANIALTPNAGMVVTGFTTFTDHVKIDDGPVIENSATGSTLKITTPSGYIEVGPSNSSYSHFYTDRGRYYFNKKIVVDDGVFSSYNEDLVLATNAANDEHVFIKTDGKVGIGTEVPAEELEVNGDISSTNLYVTSGGDTAKNNISGKFSHGGINSKSLVIGADPNNVGANTRLQFDVDGTERMRISSDGSVGIGTDNNEAAGPGIEIYSPNLDTQVRLRALDGVNKVHFDSRETNGGTYIYFTDSSATYNSFIHRSHSSNASFAGLRYCYDGSANEAIRISESGGFDMGGAGYGTAGQVLKSNGNAPPTWSGGAQRVLEVVASPCDGSTIATSNGDVTFQNVTAQQNLSTSYANVNGSIITYQPPTGTTQVIYEFNMQVTNHDDAISIAHLRFYLDGTEVVYHRRNAAGEDIDDFVNFKYIINIGGTANTNTGRIASWSNAKQMKMTAREYHSTNNAISLHTTDHWNGSGTNQFSQPVLQITAIGV